MILKKLISYFECFPESCLDVAQLTAFLLKLPQKNLDGKKSTV